MKNPTLSILFCVLCHVVSAQIGEADFTFKPVGQQIRFDAVVPPLPPPQPGGKTPFYTYFWEFGDNNHSQDSKVSSATHGYQKAGEYYAVLTTTLHYDDGKSLKKSKKKVVVTSAYSSTQPLMQDFEKQRGSIVLKAVRQPRPEEEFTMTLSYRNQGKVPTGGKIYLFFNEKVIKKSIFQFQEARTHFGEFSDNTYSFAPFKQAPDEFDWVLNGFPSHSGTQAYISEEEDWGIILDEMLSASRKTYKTETAWRFEGLQAGDQRNMFVTLDALPSMVKDTNMTIHLDGVFAPFDPQLAPEKFTLEIEIVGSHDPNLIAVSKNRANYRKLGRTDLSYKVRFQNNGEGPAKKIVLNVSVPDDLKIKNLKPVEWYPKCPVCPKDRPKTRCLDTTLTKQGIAFTFYDIYLPGSNQKGVENYDSTKGFVKYRLGIEKDMPKRAFSSRASIVFDKNPPVITNFTKTRFKPGISPGLKIGYNYVGQSDSIYRGNYFFLGVSLSPYKSWRVYPQVELLTGISGRSSYEQEGSKLIQSYRVNQFIDMDKFYTLANGQIIDGVFNGYTDSSIYEIKQGERGFITLELPFSVRKSFSRWIGGGIGISPRLIMLNGSDEVRRTAVLTTYVERINAGSTPQQFIIPEGEVVVASGNVPYRENRLEYNLFGDIHVGLVRAGPSIGLRGGVQLDQQFKFRQPFAQLSFEMKL